MSIAPSQILYLEQGSSRLYAEAIQIIAHRHLCWARPTLLIEGLPEGENTEARQIAIAVAASHPEQSTLTCYDMEDCSDLIWPIGLFSIAFDVDFFALLQQLQQLKQLQLNSHEPTRRDSHCQLNQFIRGFWPAQASSFRQSAAPTAKT